MRIRVAKWRKYEKPNKKKTLMEMFQRTNGKSMITHSDLDRLLKTVISQRTETKYPTDEKFHPLPYPQTPESAIAYFDLHGINRSEWARHFGVNQQAISDFFRGRLKGSRGSSHKTAVLLGLKAAA